MKASVQNYNIKLTVITFFSQKTPHIGFIKKNVAYSRKDENVPNTIKQKYIHYESEYTKVILKPKIFQKKSQ